jgi:hypothetical protein
MAGERGGGGTGHSVGHCVVFTADHGEMGDTLSEEYCEY